MQDKKFFDAFSRGPVTCELLRQMATKYQVARTVPGHGTKRYEQFAKMLNSFGGKQMTKGNAPEIIEKALQQMEGFYKRRFLSAITKAFWMMNRHPVVIYDRNARRGLRHYGLPSGDNDYRTYFNSWFRFFERPDTQQGLKDALDRLPKSRCAQRLLEKRIISEREVNRLLKSLWFKNRVADMRLFFAGK